MHCFASDVLIGMKCQKWVAGIDKHFPKQISAEWSRNHGPLLANLEANIELKLKNIMIIKQMYKFYKLFVREK